MGILSDFIKGQITPSVINPTLTPQAADELISKVIEQSSLLGSVTVVRTNRLNKEIDTLDISNRQLIRIPEGTEPTNEQLASVAVTRKLLECRPVNLFADLTYSTIEDNKDRKGFADFILMNFAKRFANDIDDLALNGLADGSATETTFLNLNKGFIKLAKDSTTTHKKDVNTLSSNYVTNLKAIMAEQDSRFVSDSVFIMNPSDYEGYVLEVGNKPSGVAYILSGDAPRFMGHPIITHPYMPLGTVLYTPLKNLVVGISRDIQRTVSDNPRKRALEYTFVMNVDFQIMIDEAVVIGYDIT